MTSKKHRKYKLLLDEGVHLPREFSSLNRLHNLKHIAESKYRSKSDEFVFRLAEKEGRIPVIYNTKHFKPLISRGSTSIISVSTVLTDKQVDLKICGVLRKIAPSKLRGHLIKVSPKGVLIKRIDKS